MHAGLDIDDLEQHTKIRAKYLRALENEEWALLPGPAFTKGFLRSYADALGLDGPLLIDEYKRQWEDLQQFEVNPVRPMMGADARYAGWSRGRWRRWLVLALTVVVLAIAFVLVGHLFGSGSPSSPPASTTGLGSTQSSTGRSATVAANCTPSPSATVPSDCVALRIEPVAASVYVCLVGDRRIRIDGRMLASATRTYHARTFVLTLGSRAARLVIDGHRVAVAKGSGPVRVAVTVHGSRTLAPPTRLRCVV